MGRKATNEEIATFAIRANRLFELFRKGAKPQDRTLDLLQDAIEEKETNIFVRLQYLDDEGAAVLETFRIGADTVEALAELFLTAFVDRKFWDWNGVWQVSTKRYVMTILRGYTLSGERECSPKGAVITECGGRRAWLINGNGYWEESPRPALDHTELTPDEIEARRQAFHA